MTADFTFGDDLEQPAGPAADTSTVLGRISGRTVDVLRGEWKAFPTPFRSDQGLSMAYSVYLSREDHEAWRALHGGDDWAAAVHLLRKQCRGVVEDGQIVPGPLTFNSDALKTAMGVSDGFDAVVAWYGHEGDVTRAAHGVLRACGWDLSAPLDPIGG